MVHPTDNGWKPWHAILYNYASVLQGYPSRLPGCRSIPWPSFSHQEPAGMEFWTSSSIGVRWCLYVSFLMSCAIFSNFIIRIRSNLYDGIDGIDPLLGVFVECEDDPNFEVKILVNITWNDEWLISFIQIIIQKIPVINPPAPRPVWVLTPVNKKWNPDSNFRDKGIVCWPYDGLGVSQVDPDP